MPSGGQAIIAAVKSIATTRQSANAATSARGLFGAMIHKGKPNKANRDLLRDAGMRDVDITRIRNGGKIGPASERRIREAADRRAENIARKAFRSRGRVVEAYPERGTEKYRRPVREINLTRNDIVALDRAYQLGDDRAADQAWEAIVNRESTDSPPDAAYYTGLSHVSLRGI